MKTVEGGVKMNLEGRIEKINGKIYIKLYPHELNEIFYLSEKKIVFSLEEDIQKIELSENAIESDFYFIFEYISDEKIDDETLKVYIKPINNIELKEFDYGCVVIKNISYGKIHLGYIKERKVISDISNHDFRIKDGKAICRNCGLELKIKEIIYNPIDEGYHEKIYVFENGEITEKEPHGKDCFMKCFEDETQEVINILKDSVIQDDYMITQKMKIKLNRKKEYLGTQLDVYGDRFETVSKIKYNPILVDGDKETYERMVYLLTKLRNILKYIDNFSKYITIFVEKSITIEE